MPAMPLPEPIEIQDPNHTATLVLCCREVTGAPYPSVTFSVSLSKPGFSGTNPSVGVDDRTLLTFVAALVEFDRTRQGEVVLTSLSPSEFALRIAAEDRAGHLLVRATVARTTYLGFQFTCVTDTTTLHFELDPSDFPTILKGFRAWAKTVTPAPNTHGASP